MMVLSALCTFYLCYYLKAALVNHVTFSSPPTFGVSQCISKVKTDFSTSIGWYINNISVNEITVFNCKPKLKPKMLLPFFTVEF